MTGRGSGDGWCRLTGFDAGARAREHIRGSRASPSAYIEIDATLIAGHSEKEGADGTHKGRLRLSPADGPLRRDRRSAGRDPASGYAGSDTAADHVAVIEDALAQVPGRPDRDDRELGGRGNCRATHALSRVSAAPLGRLRARRPSSFEQHRSLGGRTPTRLRVGRTNPWRRSCGSEQRCGVGDVPPPTGRARDHVSGQSRCPRGRRG
jgi:hypothetical protein